MNEAFSRQIEQQVERLRTKSLRTIEAETISKRTAWLHEHGLASRGSRLGISPRAAYELLFFDYMGLTETDLPVVRESEAEVVWCSVNPCPTLEACRELGLYTRSVCRSAYEKSTQAFLSQLDPELRFLRSYERIRGTPAKFLMGLVDRARLELATS